MISAMLAMALQVAALGDLGAHPSARRYSHLPRDVRVFIDRRMQCNHWAGEDPYDRDRARQIADAVRTLNCSDLERQERGLRRRYRNAPDVLKALTDTREDSW